MKVTHHKNKAATPKKPFNRYSVEDMLNPENYGRMQGNYAKNSPLKIPNDDMPYIRRGRKL